MKIPPSQSKLINTITSLKTSTYDVNSLLYIGRFLALYYQVEVLSFHLNQRTN